MKKNYIKLPEAEYYQITDNVSMRINILKVWLTIMVIFIHSYSENINFLGTSVNLQTPYWLEILKYIISQVVSRCAVPAFFVISSILLYRRPFLWKDNLRKKIKTLLVPYVLINTLWILIYFICQHISNLNIYFSNEDRMIANWEGKDWLQAYGILGEYPIVYPLWFMRTLFILNIFAVVIKRVVEKLKWQFLVLLLIIWVLTSQPICFWGVGCFVACKNIRLEILDKINKPFLLILYVVTIVGDVFTRSYKGNNIIHNVCIIIGIIFWFVCVTDFKQEKLNRLLQRASSYSFGIYLFHEMNLSFLKKICVRLLPVSAFFQFLEYILIPVIIIMAVLVFCIFLRRICPKCYSIITGNRAQ